MVSPSPMGVRALGAVAPKSRPLALSLDILAALALATSVLADGSARAGEPEDWSLTASLDLASDTFARGSGRPAARTPAAQNIEVGGIPLRLGTRDLAAGSGWRSVAGATARYSLPLADAASATITAKVAKTDFVDDPDRDLLAGSTVVDFRYAVAGWTLGLLPGIEVVSPGTGAAQRDLGFEGRATRPIGDDMDFAVAGRFRWRADDGPEAPGGEVLSGRFGLACALPYDASLSVAYSARRELTQAGLAPPASTETRGPALGLSVPLGRNAELSARYRFAETAHAVSGLAAAGYSDDRHQFGLDMSWEVGDRSDLRLSAKYTYEQVDSAPAEAGEERHVGTLGLALGF